MREIRRQHPDELLVLGLSLGSSQRDHEACVQMLGRTLRVVRLGTDGDFGRMLRLYSAYDGRVDAFGLGGGEFYIQSMRRRWHFRQGRLIRGAARHTPIGDGNGVKHILERQAVEQLGRHGLKLRGLRALCVSAVDRLGMARALVEQGCDVVFGDLIFSLGLPLPLRSLKAVDRAARLVAPVATQLPYSLFYPEGERQVGEPRARWSRYLEDATLLAGDFNWMRQHLPRELGGKTIVTNTTTAADVELLRERGLDLLVTSTPRFAGRSFGTNVVEAMLLAVLGKPPGAASHQDMRALIERVPLRPNVERLRP